MSRSNQQLIAFAPDAANQPPARPASVCDHHRRHGGDLEQNDHPRLGECDVVARDVAHTPARERVEADGDGHDWVTFAWGRRASPRWAAGAGAVSPTGNVLNTATATTAPQSTEASAMCRPRAQAGRPRSATSAPAPTWRTSSRLTAMTPIRTTRSPRRRRAITAMSPPRSSTTTSATRRWATLMVAGCPEGSENPLPHSGQLVQPDPAPVSTTNAPLRATR